MSCPQPVRVFLGNAASGGPVGGRLQALVPYEIQGGEVYKYTIFHGACGGWSHLRTHANYRKVSRGQNASAVPQTALAAISSQRDTPSVTRGPKSWSEGFGEPGLTDYSSRLGQSVRHSSASLSLEGLGHLAEAKVHGLASVDKPASEVVGMPKRSSSGSPSPFPPREDGGRRRKSFSRLLAHRSAGVAAVESLKGNGE